MRAGGHVRDVAAVTVLSCWASGSPFLRGRFSGTSDTGRNATSAGFVPTKVGTYRSGVRAGRDRQPALTTASARTSGWRSRRARRRGAR